MDNLLSILTFLPAIAALILIVFLKGDDPAARQNAKWLALVATGGTLAVALFVLGGFERGAAGYQFIEQREWIFGATYRVGVDGISLLFVLLTAVLMPLAVLASWPAEERVKEYMIALLLLESLLMGAFVALDLLAFYLFFEGATVPAALLLGVWGGKDRAYAAVKLCLFALVGSSLMLWAVIAMSGAAGTTCLAACGGPEAPALLTHSFSSAEMTVLGVQVPGGMQTLLWLALCAGFAIKLPLWPLHAWLPDAQGQATTPAAMVLAGLLLPLAGYGLIRLVLPMFPVATQMLAPVVTWLAVIGVAYAALVALAQTCMKRLLAYAAITQMGLATAGLMSMTQQGLDGALFAMLSHGLVFGALFMATGAIYARVRAPEIDAFGGLTLRMPIYTALLLLFVVAAIGMPGTSGFAGLVLVLVGLLQADPIVALVAALSMVVIAAALLGLYRRVALGELMKESLKAIKELAPRERLIFAPLAGLVLLLGLAPGWVTDITGPEVAALLERQEVAATQAEPVRQLAQTGD